MTKTVSFHRMQDGTREDYLLLDQQEREFARTLPDRILTALRSLEQSLGGYEELLAAALIHDIGDELAPYNHAEVAAGVIRPYVRAEVTWIVEQHGLFQTYYYAHHMGGNRHARERLRAHPWFDACASFCERWDQVSFDPDFAAQPLEDFDTVHVGQRNVQ